MARAAGRRRSTTAGSPRRGRSPRAAARLSNLDTTIEVSYWW
jgi:hypothetical protein